MKVRSNPVPDIPAVGSLQESLLAAPLQFKSGDQKNEKVNDSV